MGLDIRPRGLAHINSLPRNIQRAPQREVDHSGTDGVVSHAVDENEPAIFTRCAVWFERDLMVEREFAQADLIETQRPSGDLLEVVDVDLVLAGTDLGDRSLRPAAPDIRPPPQHWLIAEPDDPSGEPVGDLDRIRSRANDISATDIDV